MANKDKSQKEKALHKAYALTRLLFDPIGAARDEEIRARNEIEARLRFYLINDINKNSSDDVEASNNFSDKERLKYFGKARVEMEDITWESLENLLRPKNVRGAVGRVNEALQGSQINERFSNMFIEGAEDRASISHAEYIPRTVTIYESKEHAVAAAKLLRMLTAQSGATIRAEPIERGSLEPVWAVSDNMDLNTHNALRLLFTYFANKQTPEQRKACQAESQNEVNQRLPEGQKWEALEGVGTFLTLAGRPGVKMYKRLPDGRDDPEDVRRIDDMPRQQLPIYVRGVPHRSVYAADGRRYMESGDSKAIIGHLLVGPDGYAALKGNPYARKRILKLGTESLYEGLSSPSAFGKGQAIAAMGETVIDPLSKAIEIGSGCACVILTGAAMVVCAGSYSACKKLSDILSNGTWEFDPIEKKFLPYVIEKAGDPNQPRFSKTWAPRATLEAFRIDPSELTATVIPLRRNELTDVLIPLKENTIESLTGEIDLHKCQNPSEEKKWKRLAKEPDAVGREFNRFMTVKRLWPGDAENAAHGFTSQNKDFSAAREKLAIAYAEWIDQAFRYRESTQPHYSQITAVAPLTEKVMKDTSTSLANAMNEFVAVVQREPRVTSHSANAVIARTREALHDGMERFVDDRRFMVNGL